MFVALLIILIESYQLLSPGILDTTCSGKNYWVVWYRGFNVPSSSYFIVCFVAGVCHSRTFVGVGKEIENSTNGGNWWWVKRKKIGFLILIFEMKLFWLWKLKLATVKSKKADVSSVSPSSERLDEGLTLETLAFYSLWWPICVLNSVVNTKLPAILSHRRSTTVCLETYPLYSFVLALLRCTLWLVKKYISKYLTNKIQFWCQSWLVHGISFIGHMEMVKWLFWLVHRINIIIYRVKTKHAWQTLLSQL